MSSGWGFAHATQIPSLMLLPMLARERRIVTVEHNPDSVQRRYRIITPQQKNAGWLERRGDMKIRHPWDVAYRLEDGNYVVLDPALIDGYLAHSEPETTNND